MQRKVKVKKNAKRNRLISVHRALKELNEALEHRMRTMMVEDRMKPSEWFQPSQWRQIDSANVYDFLSELQMKTARALTAAGYYTPEVMKRDKNKESEHVRLIQVE